MTVIDSRQLILDFLDTWYAGDVDRSEAFFDDDIDFVCYAPVELFPMLGQKKGKAEMRQAFAGLHEHHQVLDHRIGFIAADGDHVAVMLVLRLRTLDTERVIRLDIGNFFTLRNGKILTYRQFNDSFDVVQQVLGRDIVSTILKSAP
jgi:ketosteroid isomerase-like protein